MHVIVMLLLASVVLAEAGGVSAPAPPWPALAVALGGPAALTGLAWLVARRTRRELASGRGWHAVRRGERDLRRLDGLLLVPHVVALFALGWLEVVRSMVGDIVLVDEAMALLPALLGIGAIRRCWAPIERRVREWELLDRLDRVGHDGGPVALPRLPTCGELVLDHLRTHVLLVLVPALVALGLIEGVRTLLNDSTPAWLGDVAQIAVVLMVFAIGPWIVRAVLDTAPLPEGPVRAALLEVCRRHGVGMSQLLLWRTHGSLHNAAVVGLLPRLRHVLMTDALVDDLTLPQLTAVMAHEIAHVRHRHVVVAGITLLGLAAVAGLAAQRAVDLAGDAAIPPNMFATVQPWLDGAVVVAIAATVVLGFGWVSRRLERQADTFAVKHLSDRDGPGVSADAVQTMCDALSAVAGPNGIDPRRPSWRHGSIAWRQAYLRRLVGAPLGGLAIDRQVRWIAVAGVVALAGSLVVDVLVPRQPPPPSIELPRTHSALQAHVVDRATKASDSPDRHASDASPAAAHTK